MEEAAQILEIETFIPLLLQVSVEIFIPSLSAETYIARKKLVAFLKLFEINIPQKIITTQTCQPLKMKMQNMI